MSVFQNDIRFMQFIASSNLNLYEFMDTYIVGKYQIYLYEL